MPSDLESGSERESILSAFHDHSDLKLPGEQIELDELLLDDPGYFIYELDRTPIDFILSEEDEYRIYATRGEIEIRRSKQHLEEQDMLLEALVAYDGIVDGAFLTRMYDLFVKQYTEGYVENAVGKDTDYLAAICIPENFDRDKVQKSVDTAVKILNNTHDLHNKIRKETERFDFGKDELD